MLYFNYTSIKKSHIAIEYKKMSKHYPPLSLKKKARKKGRKEEKDGQS